MGSTLSLIGNKSDFEYGSFVFLSDLSCLSDERRLKVPDLKKEHSQLIGVVIGGKQNDDDGKKTLVSFAEDNTVWLLPDVCLAQQDAESIDETLRSVLQKNFEEAKELLVTRDKLFGENADGGEGKENATVCNLETLGLIQCVRDAGVNNLRLNENKTLASFATETVHVAIVFTEDMDLVVVKGELAISLPSTTQPNAIVDKMMRHMLRMNANLKACHFALSKNNTVQISVDVLLDEPEPMTSQITRLFQQMMGCPTKKTVSVNPKRFLYCLTKLLQIAHRLAPKLQLMLIGESVSDSDDENDDDDNKDSDDESKNQQQTIPLTLPEGIPTEYLSAI